MREAVLIVLNEREPAKAKAADELEAYLKQENITSSRIEIDQNLETNVLLRKAKVVVLDYLLGDYSTGLDILSKIASIAPSSRPKVIFLTDEPSVSVAVQALQNGAIAYEEFDNPEAIKKISTCIAQLLSSENKDSDSTSHDIQFQDLVTVAEKSRRTREKIQQAITTNQKILVILGEPGSGKVTMAKALNLARQSPTPFELIDLRIFSGDVAQLPGIETDSAGIPKFASPYNLILSHTEEDNSDILKFFSTHLSRIQDRDFYLTVCCNETSVARGWKEITKATVIEIAPLRERQEDIPQLIQQFVREVENFCDKRIKLPDAETIAWLSKQILTGNLTQLKSAIYNIAFSSNFPTKQEIEKELALWQQEQLSSHQEIDPVLAAMSMYRANNNLRLAAVSLGTTQAKLKAILQEGAK